MDKILLADLKVGYLPKVVCAPKKNRKKIYQKEKKRKEKYKKKNLDADSPPIKQLAEHLKTHILHAVY
jgi:hypothetical protein